jgi:hypothetical protein
VDAGADVGDCGALEGTLPPAGTSTSATPCTSAAASAEPSLIQRVSKNSTGEALTCAECKYQMQLIVFKAAPAKLYIVLSHFGHTNDKGIICHGPGSTNAPVHQKADVEMRQFIRDQHQAGVPAARIHQGMPTFQHTYCFILSVYHPSLVHPSAIAECLARIAGQHSLNHLSPEERYQQLADVALHEIAGIHRQLIRNISAQIDKEAWRLHTSDAHSVAMRVCTHKVDA